MKNLFFKIVFLGSLMVLAVLFSINVQEKNQLKAQLQEYTSQGLHLNHSIAVDQTTFVAYNIDGEKNLRKFLENVQPNKNYLILTYSLKRRNELMNEIFSLASDYPEIVESSSINTTRLENEDCYFPRITEENKSNSDHVLAVVFRSRKQAKGPLGSNL